MKPWAIAQRYSIVRWPKALRGYSLRHEDVFRANKVHGRPVMDATRDSARGDAQID